MSAMQFGSVGSKFEDIPEEDVMSSEDEPS